MKSEVERSQPDTDLRPDSGRFGLTEPGAARQPAPNDFPSQNRLSDFVDCVIKPVASMSTRSLQFKVASEDWEFEQIHQLNYRTFVEEIPQHQSPADAAAGGQISRREHLPDLFVRRPGGGNDRGAGTAAIFTGSEAADLDSYLPAGRRTCEIRLLSVEKEFRNTQVFRGLAALMWQYGLEHGYDLGVISGTTRQQKLYRHLGFVPFGPQVGKGEAMFQPMYLTLEDFEKQAEDFLRKPARARGAASFLPGPVAVADPACARRLNGRRNRTGRNVSWRSFRKCGGGCANWRGRGTCRSCWDRARWPMTRWRRSCRCRRSRG